MLFICLRLGFSGVFKAEQKLTDGSGMVTVQAPTRKPLGWQHGWARERQAWEMKVDQYRTFSPHMLLHLHALGGDTSVSDGHSRCIAAGPTLYLMSTITVVNG